MHTQPQVETASKSSSISETTLLAARSGSFDDLSRIYSALPQCYSLQVFHIFLHHLQGRGAVDLELERLKFDPDDPPRVLVDRVNSAHPQLAYKTVLETAAALPTLLMWMSNYLRGPTPPGPGRTEADIRRNPFRGQPSFEVGHLDGILRICATATNVMHALCYLDPFTKKKFAQLNLAIQIALSLWITTVHGEPLMQRSNKGLDDSAGVTEAGQRKRSSNTSGPSTTEEPSGLVANGRADPLLEVMYELTITNPKGVVEVLASGVVCSLDMFVTRTLRRAENATFIHRAKMNFQSWPEETYDPFANTGLLVELTERLMSEPQFRDAFCKHASVSTFVDLIMATREHLSKDGLLDTSPYRYRDKITHWSSHIFEWSVNQSGSLLSNLSSVVKAGMLRVVVDSFVLPDTKTPVLAQALTPAARAELVSDIRKKHAPGGAPAHATDSVEDAKYMLSVLISYATYPRFLSTLRRQVAQSLQDRRILYHTLEEEVAEGNEYLKRRDRVHICDNLEVSWEVH
ncbi:hypothetical protein FA13DRAFT_1725602 [Coprinellus micaceus]|uniref:Uncharacterized protein n=1 Tax=Coprinellus micaceus TaxID=71717 RepID=A0A4Y7TUX7_COPMI|nr:hypothetical protein FA13DRAFT_1725602 [Coprinellus micaceus]